MIHKTRYKSIYGLSVDGLWLSKNQEWSRWNYLQTCKTGFSGVDVGVAKRQLKDPHTVRNEISHEITQSTFVNPRHHVCMVAASCWGMVLFSVERIRRLVRMMGKMKVAMNRHILDENNKVLWLGQQSFSRTKKPRAHSQDIKGVAQGQFRQCPSVAQPESWLECDWKSLQGIEK